MTDQPEKPLSILVADDDADDRAIVKSALAEACPDVVVHCVEDGEQLLDYLNRHGAFKDPLRSPRPDLIVLDLNMPRVDGRKALKEIKANPKLQRIPVMVLTTSHAENDICTTSNLGAKWYITKSAPFPDLVRTLKALRKYWLSSDETEGGEFQI